MFEAHTGVRTWFLISDLISHSRRFVISFGLFICQSEQQRASCHPFELEPAWEWREWSDIKSQTSQEISDLAERQHSPRTTVLIGAFKVSCTSELNRSYPPWLGNPSAAGDARAIGKKNRSVCESCWIWLQMTAQGLQVCKTGSFVLDSIQFSHIAGFAVDERGKILWRAVWTSWGSLLWHVFPAALFFIHQIYSQLPVCIGYR